MGTFTPIFNLFKPNGQDLVDVNDDLAENFDKIDAHAHTGTYERTYIPAGLDATGVTSASVAIQTAIDACSAAGGGAVLIDTPGTYKLSTRYMTGYTDIQAAIWLRSNVHLRCVPGVVFKLAANTTLLTNVTLANQRAHVITVIDPYTVAGVHQVKTNVRITGVKLDCNGANQSATQSIYAGVFLGSVDGAWLTDCEVFNLYGSSNAPPNESMAYDVRSSRNIHYTNCLGYGTAAAENSTGFSANYSHDVTYTACAAHDLQNGMGFTVWQCSGVRYSGCQAWLCVEANGFNAERSEQITYSGCVSGGRSPSTDGEADLPAAWFSGNSANLGNAIGWSISGCKDVSGAGNVLGKNTTAGVYVHTNDGISPTLACDGIFFQAVAHAADASTILVDDGTLHTSLNVIVASAGGDVITHYGVSPLVTYTAGNLASGLRHNINGFASGHIYRLQAGGYTVMDVLGGVTPDSGDSNSTTAAGSVTFDRVVLADAIATKMKSGAGVVVIADTDFKNQPPNGAVAFARDSTAGVTRAFVRTNGGWEDRLFAPYPKHILVMAIQTPQAQTNWNTFATSGSADYFNNRNSSSATQNDSIEWDVVLAAGTWTFELYHRQLSNNGIYTVTFDAVSVGTIDGYAAAGTTTRSTITSIAVTKSGIVRVKLAMLTKNASSSSYGGVISALGFTRTA